MSLLNLFLINIQTWQVKGLHFLATPIQHYLCFIKVLLVTWFYMYSQTWVQWERVKTSKIRMSKVQKLIKNLKKIRTLKVFLKLIRTSIVKKLSKDQNVKSVKRWLVDQKVKNQNIKKNVESQKLSKKTFDIPIFFDFIGNIRTSRVLVHFLPKIFLMFWFYLWHQKRSECQKSNLSDFQILGKWFLVINYLWPKNNTYGVLALKKLILKKLSNLS